MIASLPIYTSHIFQTFFEKKKFLRECSKPGHWNLVLITSTVEFELSKLKFNFDYIRNFFFQVFKGTVDKNFVTHNGFCLLIIEKSHPPVQWTISRWIWILTKIFYIVFQVLKVLLIKICKIQSLDLLFLVVFISFYISRYHFSQVFRTSFNITYLKKNIWFPSKIFPF